MLESVVLLFLIGVLLALIALMLYVIYGLWITSQGAFFAPSSDERIEKILKLARIKPSLRVADLGSGDGRVVMALARQGATVRGYEIDPRLLWKSRRNIRRAGLADAAQISSENFWQADLSSYDVIVIYGIDRIMKRLEKKLVEGRAKKQKIISVYFTFPTLRPVRSLGDVYLYEL